MPNAGVRQVDKSFNGACNIAVSKVGQENNGLMIYKVGITFFPDYQLQTFFCPFGIGKEKQLLNDLALVVERAFTDPKIMGNLADFALKELVLLPSPTGDTIFMRGFGNFRSFI